MATQLLPSQIEGRIAEEEKLITGEELWAMGSAAHLSELIEGRIVYMSPTGFLHGSSESNYAEKLTAFVKKHQLGKVVVGEVGVYIRRNGDADRRRHLARL
jgi:Uma2 family endonuclease